MEQRLLAPLNALETSLNNLVQALTTTNTFAAAPQAAKEIVAADDELDQALIVLKKHQDNYNEILRLRAEKDALNQKLKDTVFEAWRLRNELGNIHPSILEDSEEEEETSKQYSSVDYETLLSFASRIGKHNGIASQEAVKEAEQRYLEARRKRDEDKAASQPTMNGSHAEEPAELGSNRPRPPTSQSIHSQEVQSRLKAIEEARDIQRSFRTVPFPNGEDLRKGELGRLQLLSEQYGGETVDAEVEKMVRESEMKGPEIEQPPAAEIEPEPERKLTSDEKYALAAEQARQPQPPRPKKTIDLNFPEDDDDEDD